MYSMNSLTLKSLDRSFEMYCDEFREIDCKYVAFKRAAVCIAVTMVVKWMVATVHSNS